MTREQSTLTGIGIILLGFVLALVYSAYGVYGARTILEEHQVGINELGTSIGNLENDKAEKSYADQTRRQTNDLTTAMNKQSYSLNETRREVFGTTVSDSAGKVTYVAGLRDLVRGRSDDHIVGNDTISAKTAGLVTLTAKVDANTGARKAMATWKVQADADIERIGAYAMASNDLTAGREAFGEYHKAAKGANRAASDSAFTANASAGMAQAIGEGIAASGIGDFHTRLNSLGSDITSAESDIRDLTSDRDATRAAIKAHTGAGYKSAHPTTPTYQ